MGASIVLAAWRGRATAGATEVGRRDIGSSSRLATLLGLAAPTPASTGSRAETGSGFAELIAAGGAAMRGAGGAAGGGVGAAGGAGGGGGGADDKMGTGRGWGDGGGIDATGAGAAGGGTAAGAGGAVGL